MTSIFFLIDQLAIGLYLILAALLLFRIRQYLLARASLHATYFELERDLAEERQANALTWLVIILQFGLMLLGVQQSIVPYLENEALLSEQVIQVREETDGLFVTATPPPQSLAGLDIEPVPPLGGSGETILLLTPTLTPTPVGTIVPNAPPTEGCTDPRATLQIPANGMRVFQPVPIVGTAYTDVGQFTSAKVEIKGPSTNDTYWVIGETLQEVRNASAISQFSPAGYQAGLYQVRLIVFDLSAQPVAVCMVNIYISEPPTTPTPTTAPSGGS